MGLPLERRAERIQHFERGGGDFRADAVAGDDGDALGGGIDFIAVQGHSRCSSGKFGAKLTWACGGVNPVYFSERKPCVAPTGLDVSHAPGPIASAMGYDLSSLAGLEGVWLS